jgi:6-phosphogluconolactonase
MNSQMAKDLQIFTDMAALCHAAATHWVDLANQAVRQHGSFHVALSGGSTPRQLHQTLCQQEFSTRAPWQQVHVYWGDERAVAPEHADSNYRMARETLLDHVPIPPDQIHPMVTGAQNLAAQADAYHDLLKRNLAADDTDVPGFDLVLLGLGGDGHTASLFPGTDILTVNDRWAATVYVPQLDSWRVSLTLPVFNAARHVMVLVSGVDKADIVHDLFTQAPDEPSYPIQRIQPAGEMTWYLDRAATSRLG